MKRLRRRDWRFYLLLVAHLIGILGFVSAGLERPAPVIGGRGWRSVDRAELESRIRAGDLVDREADWYHVLDGEEDGR